MVASQGDLLELLDGLLEGNDSPRWSEFYHDKKRKIPFLVDKPDESLAGYVRDGKIKAPGQVLEFGCGNGRNAFFLSQAGFEVDAVDFSEEAIRLAEERKDRAGGGPSFFRSSIFELDPGGKTYDFIYDCGCFHHVAPHRRPTYFALLDRLLAEDGHFGLVCFSPEGGSGLSDREVYERRSLGGGLAYTEEGLRFLFSPRFDILELRRMKEEGAGSEFFGLGFLWAALMEKKPR